MHKHAVGLLFEKARVDAVSIAADRDEPCVAGGQGGVVTKRGNKPAPRGKRHCDALPQFRDCCLVWQVRKGVTHAEYKVSLPIRRQMFRKPHKVGDNRFYVQSLAERPKLLNQVGRGVNRKYPIAGTRQRNRVHSEASAKIYGEASGTREVSKVTRTQGKCVVNSTGHPQVHRGKKGL